MASPKCVFSCRCVCCSSVRMFCHNGCFELVPVQCEFSYALQEDKVHEKVLSQRMQWSGFSQYKFRCWFTLGENFTTTETLWWSLSSMCIPVVRYSSVETRWWPSISNRLHHWDRSEQTLWTAVNDVHVWKHVLFCSSTNLGEVIVNCCLLPCNKYIWGIAILVYCHIGYIYVAIHQCVCPCVVSKMISKTGYMSVHFETWKVNTRQKQCMCTNAIFKPLSPVCYIPGVCRSTWIKADVVWQHKSRPIGISSVCANAIFKA